MNKKTIYSKSSTYTIPQANFVKSTYYTKSYCGYVATSTFLNAIKPYLIIQIVTTLTVTETSTSSDVRLGIVLMNSNYTGTDTNIFTSTYIAGTVGGSGAAPITTSSAVGNTVTVYRHFIYLDKLYQIRALTDNSYVYEAGNYASVLNPVTLNNSYINFCIHHYNSSNVSGSCTCKCDYMVYAY